MRSMEERGQGGTAGEEKRAIGSVEPPLGYRYSHSAGLGPGQNMQFRQHCNLEG